MTTLETLKSEVEKRQNEVKAGMTLWYIDSCNCIKHIVTEVFEGGFEAKDDYETKDYYFNELQYGWKF